MDENANSRDEALEEFINKEYVKPESMSKPRTLFYLNSLTFLLTMASYTGLLDLQSSMNIGDGLGTTALFVMFGTASFSALMITPFVTNYLGARKTLLCGYLAMLVYAAANFYPGWWTLVPASAAMGLFESWIWVGNSKVVVYLGDEHSVAKFDERHSAVTSQIIVAKYIGYNCAFVNIGEIIGNGLSHIVLSLYNEKGRNISFTDETTNLFHNETLIEDVSSNKCGANDCQMDYIYTNSSDDLEHYLPDKVGIHIVIGIYCLLQTTAIIIAFFFVPEVPRTIFKKETKKKYADSSCPVLLRMYFCEIKRTVKFLSKKQQILMTVAEVYYGLFLAFQLSEFTRAYVSCTIGIEMIGRVAIFYAFGGIFISWLSSRLLTKLGSSVAISCLFLIHTLLLGFHVIWQPLPGTTLLLYTVSFMCGIADGGMECLTETSISEYFSTQLANGFSAKSWANGAGLGIGFAWSTPLCVETKLYVLLGFAVVAYVCWMYAEKIHLRKQQEKLDSETEV